MSGLKRSTLVCATSCPALWVDAFVLESCSVRLGQQPMFGLGFLCLELFCLVWVCSPDFFSKPPSFSSHGNIYLRGELFKLRSVQDSLGKNYVSFAASSEQRKTAGLCDCHEKMIGRASTWSANDEQISNSLLANLELHVSTSNLSQGVTFAPGAELAQLCLKRPWTSGTFGICPQVLASLGFGARRPWEFAALLLWFPCFRWHFCFRSGN